MEQKPKRLFSLLAEVELETLEEGREWTRRRLERKLQKIADEEGDFSPLGREFSGSTNETPDSPENKRRGS